MLIIKCVFTALLRVPDHSNFVTNVSLEIAVCLTIKGNNINARDYRQDLHTEPVWPSGKALGW